MKMKKRILKKWVEKWLCIESIIIFCFVGMINDFTLLGLFILIGLLLKLGLNINILSKYTNLFEE